MTKKSQDVLQSTSAESRKLIRLMLEDLHSRLKVLEDQAKKRQESLASKSGAWNTLKVIIQKITLF